MSDLIDVFLMLARESGPSPIETAQAWSLEPVIREILDARSEDLKHKGLTVELDARGHPAASAPRAVLTVVFGNLLGNAIAYSRNGRIRITLEDDGDAVEDTGPGIPLSDEPHVFQRAYRGRRCPDEGAGLGLAIVQRLCGRYGWRVGVGSPEGQGARVWLDFSASAKSKG
jgi:signal transduction histidine kinase